jgi:hypothetical protein
MDERLRVYVAGSSDPQERGRVKVAMMQVKGHPNMELTLDWVSMVEAAGSANEGLSLAQREDASEDAIRGVISADVVWLLAPDHVTRGAWYECGIVEGWNRAQACTQWLPRRRIAMIASGQTQQSIFCSRMLEVESDKDAFFDLCKMAAKR